jgi:molybdenum cofactor cytidylyltransferase
VIFGRVPLARARGGILAHNLQTRDRVLRKGALIDADAYALLADAGYEEVTIARLEPGDTPEGEAATLLGEALLRPHLTRSPDVHGRVNLFAATSGLLRLDTALIQNLNLVDEAITLATLADYSVVEAGDMVATLKIIPFAVGAAAMEAARRLIAEGTPLEVRPFAPLTVGLILSTLPQLKPAALTHTIEATAARVEAHGGTLLAPLTTPHEAAPLTAAIHALRDAGAGLVLISGASAVTDRLDVAPRAIVAAGGEITHFGMPVDPGNLICFGHIGGTPAIVLPGCARSPKLNGIDWVLDRIFASEPIGPVEIAAMGAGGLLKEMESRPAPRAAAEAPGYGAAPRARTPIAAIVLAAGRSTRMGPLNKLLARLPDGQAMVARTLANVTASGAHPVLVVTGHEEEAIRQALAGESRIRFVHAETFADGMSASLQAGIAALAGEIGGALICLGDMPLVPPAVLREIIAAWDPDEGREIVIPIHDGQRGNPVLWGRRFFPELLNLQGDAGARQILHHHMEFVFELPVASDSVLRDFDTAEALATLST